LIETNVPQAPVDVTFSQLIVRRPAHHHCSLLFIPRNFTKKFRSVCKY
jgi:hypothetical protein